MEVATTKPVKIEQEMQSSYLDYAMSVIVSRALPNVYDGLKPVHRRILYAMGELGLYHTSSYKKSARIVGEVLGKYHPHGDTSVYEALVRMAQDFSMRYPLIDGQGNFGSVDNDPAAAMRYTEARLAEIAREMLTDIDKNTVDFTPNFDNSLREPVVLPSRMPNLLLNGSSGIAVGMATNIPPHNLTEVCDAVSYLIDNPEAGTDELIDFIPGPDFPTGGIILGRDEVRKAYTSGRGRLVVRAKTHLEESSRSGCEQIVVTELPYQVNKAALVERIAKLAREKKIEGISELRDESDRTGMRITIELKKEAQPEQVRNGLYKYTPMQSTFFVNTVALVEGEPRVLSLRELLQHYIDFRCHVITRRSKFELDRARARAHILEGLKVALDNLDRVIAIIRRSDTVENARKKLMQNFALSQEQAQAILDMQLRRLASLERKKIVDEYTEVLKTIAYLEDLLANPKKILFLIKGEMADLKSKYGDERRTYISEREVGEFSEEDLIPHQKVVVALSNKGYIKRQPSDTYRLQHRGGRGIIGVKTKEQDIVRLLLTADTHDNLLFFTNRGRVFRLRCYEIPSEISRTSKGIPITNLIPIDQDERITAMVGVTDFDLDKFMLLATKLGEVKKTALEEFASVRSSGLIAMDMERNDELVTARLARRGDELILMSKRGKAIKFAADTLRTASRISGGVRGIHLAPGDQVVGLDVASAGDYLLLVTDHGFGKITPLNAYPLQNRGGGGVRAHKITPKTGEVIAAQIVSLAGELMVISTEGIIIRTPIPDISIQGRGTQGVSLMKLDPGDMVASIACIERNENRPQKRG